MSYLPNGLDWADGLTLLPTDASTSDSIVFGAALGTATPAANLLVQASSESGQVLEELPDSPEFERAEQCTGTHRFTMSYDEAATRIASLYRGKLVYDSLGDIYLVLSAKVQRRRGNTAELTVVTEAKTFDSPPDEFEVVPVELGLSIIKHPRYYHAFLGGGQNSSTERANQQVIRLLQDYMENPSALYRNAIADILTISLADANYTKDSFSAAEYQTAIPEYIVSGAAVANVKVYGTAMAKRAALEIMQKYWRGEETPYIVGYQVTLSRYYFLPPAINPGGYIEDPIANNELPDYFLSMEWPPGDISSAADSQCIFSALAAYNPQCYSSTGEADGAVSLSFLRKADELEFQRTWFKLRKTWMVAAVGHWDAQLYNQNARPSVPGDYNKYHTDTTA